MQHAYASGGDVIVSLRGTPLARVDARSFVTVMVGVSEKSADELSANEEKALCIKYRALRDVMHVGHSSLRYTGRIKDRQWMIRSSWAAAPRGGVPQVVRVDFLTDATPPVRMRPELRALLLAKWGQPTLTAHLHHGLTCSVEESFRFGPVVPPSCPAPPLWLPPPPPPPPPPPESPSPSLGSWRCCDDASGWAAPSAGLPLPLPLVIEFPDLCEFTVHAYQLAKAPRAPCGRCADAPGNVLIYPCRSVLCGSCASVSRSEGCPCDDASGCHPIPLMVLFQ
jgi:hypothetical protein